MKKILLALGMLVLPLLGWAQSCPFWQEITFVDSKKACLGDYPFLRTPIAESGRSVQSLVTNLARYSVSAPIGDSNCPAVLGTGFGHSANNIHLLAREAAQREQDSMRSCEAKLAKVGGNPGCACAQVLADGTSRLTKAEFDARFLGGSPASATSPPSAAGQALAAAPGSGATSCPFWQQLAFEDGKSVCLNQYTLSRQPAAGFGRAVETMIPPVGLYALAASMGEAASCPVVVGLSAEVLSGSVAFASGQEQVRRREEISLRACENALAAHKVPADCTCKNIVTDGRSLVARQIFEARFAERSGVASAPLPVAAAPAPAKPAPVPGAVPAVGAATPVSAAAPSAPAAPPVPAVASPAPAAAPTAALSPAVQVPRMTAHALVIGNSKYSSFGALANPGRDAKAIADKLKSFGIPVDLLLDAQRDDLIHALNEHSRRAAGKDISILFYAGHGVQVEGTNYLIPVNMRADGLSAGYVKLAGISLNATLDYMPAKTRLIFLDACRDNPAARVLVSSRSASAPGLAAVNAASGTLFSYATRDGATADDGDGLNSPYTTALLKHLDKPMDISLVLRQVRQTVLQLTGGRQEPWEYGSLVGDQIVLPLMARPAN